MERNSGNEEDVEEDPSDRFGLAYMEYYVNGRLRVREGYIDMFPAARDEFIDSLEGLYEQQEVDRCEVVLPLIPPPSRAEGSIPQPPMGKSQIET